MRLIVVRHGETDWNFNRMVQGRTNTELNEKGLWQAECIAERLSRMRLDGVISSPLKRAYDTGKAIADRADLPIATEDLLHELDFGDWEGKTFLEIKEVFPQEHAQWCVRPDLPEISGSEEDTRAAQGRVRRWVEDLYAKDPEKAFVVVTHTWPAKLLLMHALHMELQHAHSLRLDNAGMSIVERNEDGWAVRLMNDISHLRGGERCRKLR